MDGKCIVGCSCVVRGPEKCITARIGPIAAGIVKTPGSVGLGLAPLGAIYYSGGRIRAKSKDRTPRLEESSLKRKHDDIS